MKRFDDPATGDSVNSVPIQDFARACRLFLRLAYPEGAPPAPANKQRYAEIPLDAAIADYLSGAPFAAGICQDLAKNGVQGFEFRLGCVHHPNLKLRVQRMEVSSREVWVFSVDTHDRFLQPSKLLGDEETEWRAFCTKNTVLKQKIEEALAEAGLG